MYVLIYKISIAMKDYLQALSLSEGWRTHLNLMELIM